MRTLQSRLYSSLAQQVSNAILGENAQRQSTIKCQDQEVFFERTGNEIRDAITDLTTGQVTEFILPTV
jgi:curli production assembly/transport component CsgF